MPHSAASTNRRCRRRARGAFACESWRDPTTKTFRSPAPAAADAAACGRARVCPRRRRHCRRRRGRAADRQMEWRMATPARRRGGPPAAVNGAGPTRRHDSRRHRAFVRTLTCCVCSTIWSRVRSGYHDESLCFVERVLDSVAACQSRQPSRPAHRRLPEAALDRSSDALCTALQLTNFGRFRTRLAGRLYVRAKINAHGRGRNRNGRGAVSDAWGRAPSNVSASRESFPRGPRRVRDYARPVARGLRQRGWADAHSNGWARSAKLSIAVLRSARRICR